MDIGRTLAGNVEMAWGAEGVRWLADLPALAASVAADWELETGPPFPLSFHWVVPAKRSDGTAAVLKLGVPGSQHFADHAAALEAFAGRGSVRLLAHDPARGAQLLERAKPGTPARDLVPDRDADATAATIAVIRRLHAPPPPDCPLPDLAAQGADFAKYLRAYPDDGPLPRHLVERAATLHDELCASATARVVLHGDLHHDNVLRSEREPWLSIDPFGMVGDPASETGVLLYNPDPPLRDNALLELVPARIEQLADGLGQPVERVVAWGFVKAVLSEVWDVEGGHTEGGRALDVAWQLLPRLP